MKFFNATIKLLISNCLMENWDALYDAPNILEPFHPLNYRYSKHHNQLPKNADHNTSFSGMEIPAANDANYVLSSSSPRHSDSKKVDIQREGVHGLCSQRLSKYGYSRNRIFGSEDLDNAVVYRLSERDNGIVSPKPDEQLTDLMYANYDDNPYSKGKNFIQTESSRNEIEGF